MSSLTRASLRALRINPWGQLRRVVTLCLSLALLEQLAQLGVDLAREQRRQSALALADLGGAIRPDAARPDAARPDAARPDAARPDFTAIVAAHLFGDSSAREDPRSLVIEQAPFEWVLSGVIEASPPHPSLAMIGTSPAATRLRFVGEEIVAGFRLARVFPDHVLVDHFDRQLIVRLRKSEEPRGSPNHAVRNSNVVDVSDSTALLPTTVVAWHPPKGQPYNRPPAMALLKPQIHLDSDGHYNGMRVVGPGNGSVLSGFGLQRDDVITKVNGRALSTPEVALQALAQMSSGSTVTVTIERGGYSQDLPLTLPGGGS